MEPSSLEKTVEEITPIEEIEGVFYKRDDLYQPIEGLNGGKLRQGIWLLSTVRNLEGCSRVLTGCSVHSAQVPIAAAVAQHFGIPCVAFYGGKDKESILQRYQMPRLVQHYGGEIRMAPCGRSNVLLSMARREQKSGEFVLEYGVNCQDPEYLEAFYGVTAHQVQNIPDELDNLVVDCGSGITVSGILYGISKYQKKVHRIWVIGTAPNRRNKILDRLISLQFFTGVQVKSNFEYIDLFAKGLAYETAYEEYIPGGVELHPLYEAKAYRWMRESKLQGKTCFWVVGSLPKLLR